MGPWFWLPKLDFKVRECLNCRKLCVYKHKCRVPSSTGAGSSASPTSGS